MTRKRKDVIEKNRERVDREKGGGVRETRRGEDMERETGRIA